MKRQLRRLHIRAVNNGPLAGRVLGPSGDCCLGLVRFLEDAGCYAADLHHVVDPQRCPRGDIKPEWSELVGDGEEARVDVEHARRSAVKQAAVHGRRGEKLLPRRGVLLRGGSQSIWILDVVCVPTYHKIVGSKSVQQDVDGGDEAGSSSRHGARSTRCLGPLSRGDLQSRLRLQGTSEKLVKEIIDMAGAVWTIQQPRGSGRRVKRRRVVEKRVHTRRFILADTFQDIGLSNIELFILHTIRGRRSVSSHGGLRR